MLEQDSGLEQLRKRLYKEQDVTKARLKREELPKSNKDFKTYWDNPDAEEKEQLAEIMQNMPKKKKRKSIFFIAAGLVFILLVAGAIIFYLFDKGWLGGSVVSSKNIDIEINGPSMINAGERNSWTINITNHNSAQLEIADLTIDYPSDSFDANGNKIFTERRIIGEILPGATKQEILNFFALGKERDQKEITVILEYRVQDSNAIFAKVQKTIIEFARSPVGITITVPKEVESGQEIKFILECVSNSNTALKDLYVKVDYPPGFQFIDSSVEPVEGKNVWKIGDLAPREEYKLEISGIIQGQDMTELTFQGSVGPRNSEKELNAFISSAGSTLLKKPFLNLDFLVNDKDTDAIYKTGTVRITIPWENNLPEEIRNASIKISLPGNVVNLKTVKVENGSFRSYDNAIIWNASSLPRFSVIAPGAEGLVAFSFSFLDSFSVKSSGDKNFTLDLVGEMSGFRSGQDGQSVEVKGSVEKQIKISSNIQVARSADFDSGFLPPRVGEENSYTVTWSISNFYNDVENVVVRSSLPSYVFWVGNFQPAGEDLTYNNSTGEIIWKIPKVEAGTGILVPLKQVKFKITFFPSINQIGEMPVLFNRLFLEGKDSFTELVLTDYKDPFTTGSVNQVGGNSFLGIVNQ